MYYIWYAENPTQTFMISYQSSSSSSSINKSVGKTPNCRNTPSPNSTLKYTPRKSPSYISNKASPGLHNASNPRPDFLISLNVMAPPVLYLT
ncbi:hypothetical protein ACHAXM_002750 [Skeletonema potamos]